MSELYWKLTDTKIIKIKLAKLGSPLFHDFRHVRLLCYHVTKRLWYFSIFCKFLRKLAFFIYLLHTLVSSVL